MHGGNQTDQNSWGQGRRTSCSALPEPWKAIFSAVPVFPPPLGITLLFPQCCAVNKTLSCSLHHVFIHQTYMEPSPCTRHCARFWQTVGYVSLTRHGLPYLPNTGVPLPSAPLTGLETPDRAGGAPFVSVDGQHLDR